MDRLISDHGVNDTAVMEAMVVEYRVPVYRLALSILRDPADAQDAAQNTFIQAAAGLQRYQVGTNFKAWLLRIAINNCYMLQRKHASRRALQRAWESLSRLGFHQRSPETQAMHNEMRNELWTLVDNLNDKHRLVVTLRFAYEMTVSEISQVLGINEKTVYSRLYDAFAQLRALIKVRPEYAHLRDEVKL